MKNVNRRILSFMMLAVPCVFPSVTSAQTPAPNPSEQTPPIAATEANPTRGFVSALAHNLGTDLKQMPTTGNLFWLAAGGAGALLIHPKDRQINRHLVGSAAADRFFKPGKYVGNTAVLLGTASAAYVIGRTKNKPRAAHLGMDEIEALALAEGIGHAVKYMVRRDRPVDIFTGEKQKGYSFPGGHATVTFSFATVLARHLGYKVAVPTYLLATYVATSRLHDNRHYPSDVAFGAALGIVIGRSVTSHGGNFWGGPSVFPLSRGFAVMFNPRMGRT